MSSESDFLKTFLLCLESGIIFVVTKVKHVEMMTINFKHFNSSEECRTAFMKMVHGKDLWEAQMHNILAQQQAV